MAAEFPVTPVGHAAAVTPARGVGDAAADAEFRFEQFNLAQLQKGQLYQGKVIAQLDSRSFLVALNGSALKMTLGVSTKVGDFVSLRYVGGFPAPTFLLAAPPAGDSQTSISATARLIDQYIAGKPLTARFEAGTPVTATPDNASGRIATDLRQALTLSGLFYESHLVEFMLGKRPLSAILQEPQNQPAATPAALVPQQLQLLEQQRLLWHGEIWPRQAMDWEIDDRRGAATAEEEEENDTISSTLRLRLPRLGEVTARLHYAQGRMQLELTAREKTTVARLKEASGALTARLQAAGQTLTRCTVQANDEDAAQS